jgi:AcrR family transcriptional regulator
MQIRKPEIRKRLLDIARGAFLTGEFETVTLRTIAREAGITVGNLYHYFRNKDDLYMAVFLEFNARRLEWVFGEMEKGADPLSRLRLYAQAQFCFVRQYPDEFRLAMRYDQQGIREQNLSDEIRTAFGEQRQPYFDRFVALVEEGRSCGQIRSDIDTECLIQWITMTLRLMLNEVVVLKYHDESFYRGYADFLIDAIQPRVNPGRNHEMVSGMLDGNH